MTQLPAETARDDVRTPKSKSKPRKHHQPDAAFDSLVPDTIARAELGGVSKMSWWRWERDARMLALGFPVAITLCDRKYRCRAELEAFKARLMREAIKDRSKLKRGPKPKSARVS